MKYLFSLIALIGLCSVSQAQPGYFGYNYNPYGYNPYAYQYQYQYYNWNWNYNYVPSPVIPFYVAPRIVTPYYRPQPYYRPNPYHYYHHR